MFPRFPETPKAFDARVALLAGLAAATRLRSQGPGLGRRFDPDGGEKSPGTGQPVPHQGAQTPNGTSDAASGLAFGVGIGPGADERAAAERAERAEKTAEAVVAEASKCKGLARAQVGFGGGGLAPVVARGACRLNSN